MAALVGARLVRSDESSLEGIVVSVRHASTWSTGLALYDVVWSDGSCSVKVTAESMTQAGWKQTGERLDAAECNRIWIDYQVERAKRLALAHSRGLGSQPARPIVVDRQQRLRMPPLSSAARPSDVHDEQLAAANPVEFIKPASWHARRLLAGTWPDVQFAVTVDRKKLSVGWIDGPTESAVERSLTPLIRGGRVEKLIARRGLNESQVQAAIDLVLERTWGGRGAGYDLDRLRLLANEYLSGAMPPLATPIHSSIGVMPYRNLIRLVLDEWDQCEQRFVEVDRTRHMVQETHFLYPEGRAAASVEFRSLVELAIQGRDAARDFMDQLPRCERARN